MTLFTTTISYHGPSREVNTEDGIPIDFTEKGAEKDLTDSAMRAPSTRRDPSLRAEMDVGQLPV